LLVAVDDQRVVELPSLALPGEGGVLGGGGGGGLVEGEVGADDGGGGGGGRGGGAGAVGRGHRHANGLADVGGGE
jgi:hypothetical protein